jgi:hypothetical protein
LFTEVEIISHLLRGFMQVMTRLVTLMFVLFSSSLWAMDLKELIKDPANYHNKEVEIKGIIKDIKKNIWARHNFYTFKIMLNEKHYVEVKYYSILNLRQINQFYCSEGLWTTLKGRFNHRSKGDRVGKMQIAEKALLICTERLAPEKTTEEQVKDVKDEGKTGTKKSRKNN